MTGVASAYTWRRTPTARDALRRAYAAARLIPGATLRTFVSGHEPHAEVHGRWLAAVQEFPRTLPAPRAAAR